MGFASTKQVKDEYKNQKQNNGRMVPVDGVFNVVNKALQFQTVGANETVRLRVITHVLGVVDAKDTKGARAMVGKTMGIDIWWHKPAKGEHGSIEGCDFNLIVNDEGTGLAFNGKKLMFMAIANGCDDDIEEAIVNRDLVDVICDGRPYVLNIEVEASQSKGKTFYNIEPIEMKRLKAEKVKLLTEAPDFGKILDKDKAKRLLEEADYSKPKQSGGENGNSHSDPYNESGAANDKGDEGFYDDDLPF